MISQERLKELFNYNKENGDFTRKEIRHSQGKVGEIAGCKLKGYTIICVDRIKYRAHWLAWLYVYGVLPNGFLDHINREKSDNRIANLRLASTAENNQNTECPRRQNKTGFLGVDFDKQKNMFRSSITKNYKQIFIGYFDTPEEAHKAYLVKKLEVHEFYFQF